MLNHNQKGFTLVELAIAMIIVAVIAGGFVTSMTKKMENARIDETRNELEAIKQAMFAYAFTNSYLPCPDCIDAGSCPNGVAKNGIEDRTLAGACSVGGDTGNIPWVTLGIERGDGWSTHYRYWVQADYADNGGFTLASAAPNGVINERDAADAVVELSDDAIAIIFSHGKNRYGGVDVGSDADLAAPPAANIDELVNTDNDNIFFSRPGTTEDAATDGGEFDDILVWVSEIEIKGMMVRAGALP